MNSFFGSHTSFRFRVLLPPLLVLLFLIGLISVGGNLWIRDVTRRLQIRSMPQFFEQRFGSPFLFQ